MDVPAFGVLEVDVALSRLRPIPRSGFRVALAHNIPGPSIAHWHTVAANVELARSLSFCPCSCCCIVKVTRAPGS